MNFSEAVKSCFSKYVDFSGRAPRSEYWWFHLFYVGCFLGLSLVSIFVLNVALTALILSLAWLAVVLGMILPSLAVGVRRLHDQDKSGWWYVIVFLPFGPLILLIFFVLEGTEGPNRFGPDPLSDDPQDSYVDTDTKTYARSSIPTVRRR